MCHISYIIRWPFQSFVCRSMDKTALILMVITPPLKTRNSGFVGAYSGGRTSCSQTKILVLFKLPPSDALTLISQELPINQQSNIVTSKSRPCRPRFSFTVFRNMRPGMATKSQAKRNKQQKTTAIPAVAAIFVRALIICSRCGVTGMPLGFCAEIVAFPSGESFTNIFYTIGFHDFGIDESDLDGREGGYSICPIW